MGAGDRRGGGRDIPDKEKLLSTELLEKLPAFVRNWPAVLFEKDDKTRRLLNDYANLKDETLITELQQHLFSVLTKKIEDFIQRVRATPDQRNFLQANKYTAGYRDQMSVICLHREIGDFEKAKLMTRLFFDYMAEHEQVTKPSLALVEKLSLDVAKESASMESMVLRDDFNELVKNFLRLSVEDKERAIKNLEVLSRSLKEENKPMSGACLRLARALSQRWGMEGTK